MKRFAWRCFAVSSLLAVALAATAETRPRYGGTLHVAVREAPTTLDPADNSLPDSFARRNLTVLIFETLVTIDESGRVRPELATSWQAAPGNRWQLRVRRGVQFQDGSALTAESVAASLRTANPSWNVSAEGDSVVIQRDEPDPDLPAELALPRNAIVRRNPDGTWSGTGAFRIAEWQPGKKLSLAANEDCWRGRPFVDAVEIEMGQNFHDQLMALELGRVDVIEVAAEQSRRVSMEGQRVVSSAPAELVALQFAREAQSDEEKALRAALALSVDRASIRNVLLQGAGQSAGGILPDWMSGYGFVFPVDADLTRARHEAEQVRSLPVWTVGYDGSDSISRLLVERIILNARDAGLKLQATAGNAADVRLVRIPLASEHAWVSLADVAATAGLPKPKRNGGSVEDLYAAEQAMLATQRLIPLFHLPGVYAASPAVKDWALHRDGSWDLADAWLEIGRP